MKQILPKSYDRILLLLATVTLVWVGVQTQPPAKVVDTSMAIGQKRSMAASPEASVSPLAIRPDYNVTLASTESPEAIPVITHVPTTQKVVF